MCVKVKDHSVAHGKDWNCTKNTYFILGGGGESPKMFDQGKMNKNFVAKSIVKQVRSHVTISVIKVAYILGWIYSLLFKGKKPLAHYRLK